MLKILMMLTFGLGIYGNLHTIKSSNTYRKTRADHMNSPTFSPDNSVNIAAENYANQAVSYALDTFNIKLNWSDNSIKDVEMILDQMHQQSLIDKPSFKDMFLFAKAFGSYIGEVYKRNHGAKWGLFTWNDQIFPGLRPQHKAPDFWPWSKAQKRIENGAEENVWHYYQHIIKTHIS